MKMLRFYLSEVKKSIFFAPKKSETKFERMKRFWFLFCWCHHCENCEQNAQVRNKNPLRLSTICGVVRKLKIILLKDNYIQNESNLFLHKKYLCRYLLIESLNKESSITEPNLIKLLGA